MPSTMAPAARTLSTTAESCCGTLSLNSSDPCVVRMPAVIWVSLMETGRPCRGPRVSPLRTALSAALADAMAWSPATRMNDLRRESSRSMRRR